MINLSRIILTDVAKYGVKDAVIEKRTKEEDERYAKLVEEANERIRLSRRKQSDAWFSAMNYRAKSNDTETSSEKVYKIERKK